MTLAALKAFALSLPHATVVQQWGDVLVFKVGGKMFLLVSFEGSLPEAMSFRPDTGQFEELASTDGLKPAPYLARAGWIQVCDLDAVSPATLREWIRTSHAQIVGKLPKNKRKALGL